VVDVLESQFFNVADGKHYTDRVEVRLVYDWVTIPGTEPIQGNRGLSPAGSWGLTNGNVKTWVLSVPLNAVPGLGSISGNVGYQIATNTAVTNTVSVPSLPASPQVEWKVVAVQERIRKYYVHTNPPPPGKEYVNSYEDEMYKTLGVRVYKKSWAAAP
jgi:hypothetical protein